MAKLLCSHLDPKSEADFLDLILSAARTAARMASGKQQVVVGHYQSQFEARRAEIEKLLKPARKSKQG